jgi:hypothetical protein
MAHSGIQKSHGDFLLTRSFRIASLLATTAIVCAAGAARAEQTGPRPLFAVIRHAPTPEMMKNRASASFPATWVYSYTYESKTYNETWIGANPSSATTETVPVYLIPLNLTWTTVNENAKKVIKSIVASPIFTPYDFTFGGTDIGSTQYEDAFAKVNVWSLGGSASGYHVSLAETTTKVTKVTVPSGSGATGSPFGTQVLLVDINWLDGEINTLIKTLKIPASAFPMFVTTQTYLYSGNSSNCCIGGYHSVTSAGQPYGMFTYIKQSGEFSQDVSALSHELGEWVDDPYTANNSPCGIYEVGDPLERETNYGDYAFKVGSFTYHLQDLALLPYFGGPTGVTLDNLFTLQGTKLRVCQNGA